MDPLIENDDLEINLNRESNSLNGVSFLIIFRDLKC